MFARKGVFWSVGRSTLVWVVTALALSAIEPSLAFAGKGAYVTNSAATDFSARRKSYRRGSYRGGAAAAAAFSAIVGTGIAIAAAQNSQAYYGGYYGYGGPVYVAPAPGPYYYGYDPSYGPNQYGADVPYVNGHPLAGW